MHYPGNNTVPRANFSAPTFQVDGMADKKFRGLSQVNVTIDRH